MCVLPLIMLNKKASAGEGIHHFVTRNARQRRATNTKLCASRSQQSSNAQASEDSLEVAG
jgi:hypothetical protein